MCEEAPMIVLEFESMGAPCSRLDSGLIAQRPLGGAGFPRTCYTGDRTGNDPIPVQPSQHYSMGGIASKQDADFCETPLLGLWAVGETSCISVHEKYSKITFKALEKEKLLKSNKRNVSRNRSRKTNSNIKKRLVWTKLVSTLYYFCVLKKFEQCLNRNGIVLYINENLVTKTY